MKTNEFYIGYLPAAPPYIARIMRRAILSLVLICVIVLFSILAFQKNFDTTTFEYGVFTEVEGNLFKYPVPHVVIYLGKDFSGNELLQNILLVSPEKAGADNIVELLLQSKGVVEGDKVSLQGFLIYGDGKALLQISENGNALKVIAGSKITQPSLLAPGKTITASGEVVDPKCYFGVMKPGEGKPHRSCAIRCISGGIPPIFHVAGTSTYFLVVDEDGHPVSDQIFSLVGDNITLTGEVFSWNDWQILKVKRDDIFTQRAFLTNSRALFAFQAGMTVCGNNH